MSNPGDGDPKPEFSDSDQAWYAALSGEASADPTAPAAREGQALRAALEQRRHALEASAELAAATADDAMQAQLQQLRRRIKAEGLFERPAAPAATPTPPPAAPSNVVAFPWWRRRVALAGLAASLMLGVVVLQIQRQPDYPLPNETFGTDGLQKTQAAKPRELAERLASQLTQAGLRPGLYQRGSTYVVDVTLMASELPAAEPAFAALQLKPAAGFNRVEISPAER